jgi:hypothetical protein
MKLEIDPLVAMFLIAALLGLTAEQAQRAIRRISRFIGWFR